MHRRFLLLCATVLSAQPRAASVPAVPEVWNDEAVATLRLPLANPAYSPIPISRDAYYRMPVRTIYKSYPVYHPGREPAGYQDWAEKPGAAGCLRRGEAEDARGLDSGRRDGLSGASVVRPGVLQRGGCP